MRQKIFHSVWDIEMPSVPYCNIYKIPEKVFPLFNCVRSLGVLIAKIIHKRPGGTANCINIWIFPMDKT